MLIVTKGGTGFPQQAYLQAGRKLMKKSRPSKCSPPPLSLKIPGNNWWVRNTVGKPWSCPSLASLAGFVYKPESWTSPLPAFTGSALSVGLLHFEYFEAYCNTNIRKWSKMVLHVYWNSQTVLSLSTWIAIWALEQCWEAMLQAIKVGN